MNKKIFGTILVSAVVLLGVGCAAKTTVPANQLNDPAAVPAGQPTGKVVVPTSNFSDMDKCIELMAYTMVVPQYGTNVAALTAVQQKVDNMKQQFGWSDEQIQTICGKVVQQPDFMPRVTKRMQAVILEIK